MIYNDTRGMTLIELIVAMGIFGLLITSIVGVFLVSNKSKDIVFDQLEVQGQARKAIQDFVNEARAMRYSSAGAYPLQTASATQFIFYTNMDTDSSLERVRYYLVTSTLKRGIVQPTGSPVTYPTSTESIVTIVNNVNNTSTAFFYYDENYTGVTSTPLTQPVDSTRVRIVEMRLIVDKNANLSPVPFTIQGQTHLRNLKSN